MAKFKVGDKVMQKPNCNATCGVLTPQTEYLMITNVGDGSGNDYSYNSYDKNGEFLSSCTTCLKDEHLQAYKNYKNKMSTNIIEKIKLAKVPEPDKSLVKAGITDIDGSFTEEGLSILHDFLRSKFGEDLKKVYADDIIKEQEDEK